MAPLLPDQGSNHEKMHVEMEVDPASYWGSWLEVNSTCRQGRRRSVDRQRNTLAGTGSSGAKPSTWQISRFSPTSKNELGHRMDGLLLSEWLCPRQLEATSADTAKDSVRGKRHSVHSLPLTAKPALKRMSVASTEETTSRRVSFSDITDTREVESSTEAKNLLKPAESSVRPSDEALAAFRVKAQFEETELPPSLRSHPRYHSAGHHHHNLATLSQASQAPVIDEGMPSGAGVGYVPLRTRVSEVQGARGISLRKLPHYKIRVRRAFSRARMMHPHHHAHHLHNGPIVLGETPIATTSILHIRVPSEVAPVSPVVTPVPTVPEPASTPLTAAALQRHEALMQQPQTDSASDAMAMAGVPASLSLGMSMHQGAIFGVVSTIAVEAMQLSLAQKRGSAATQTANFASAAARGAAVGAAGGGMALLLGPVAPTAIFVGYGLIREWSAQGYAWLQNQTTGPLALSRAVEVSGSAAGGVACAMAAATLLSGFSGVAIAAAAGCSGFAGSLGGREVAAVCFQHLSTELSPPAKRCKSRSSKSSRTRSRRSSQLVPFEPSLLEAYSILGVDPQCSNAELKRAYRQAVLSSHSADVDSSQTRFEDVIEAMEKIRSTRQTPLQLDLVPDIWLEPMHLARTQTAPTAQRAASSRASDQGDERNGLPALDWHGSDSDFHPGHLAGFMGGMAAQAATTV